MFNWFRDLLFKRNLTPPPADLDPYNADLSTLDIPGAMQAHLNWHKRLRDVIHDESDEVLDVNVVKADCNCALGKWIYSDGKAAYGHSPMYEDLRLKHARFHVEAGEVLYNAQRGERIKAQRRLMTTYAQASKNVLRALEQLHNIQSRTR